MALSRKRLKSCSMSNATVTPESLLAKLKEGEQARLRVYINAAPGVGKTYQMLKMLICKEAGGDIVAGLIEPTAARYQSAIGDFSRCLCARSVPRSPWKTWTLRRLSPAIQRSSSLTNLRTPTYRSKNRKLRGCPGRWTTEFQSLPRSTFSARIANDVVNRTTGVRVRETVPDHFLRRADEVVNVDVSVDTLRTRLRQGKIYDVAKIQQSLNNFFRKGNLSALRELALRQLATDQATKAQDYRHREGLDHAVIPEKVMVAMASRGSAKKLLRVGSRVAGRLASDWYAVYVETPGRNPVSSSRRIMQRCRRTFALLRNLGRR